MAFPGTGSIVSLNNDLVTEILRRVDGTTLANAGCACSGFRSIAREERIWEDACCSLWPSTVDQEVKSLISSLGGFRKFYGDCFPLIVYKKPVASAQLDSNFNEMGKLSDGSLQLHTVCPSDFVSIVDVQYKNRAVYSKVLWGIPGADDLHGWFSNCPFRIDLFSFPDEDESHEGQMASPIIADGLPSISSIERERKDGRFWRDVWDNIKLSWILINRRTKQAVNLASWSPLGGQRHWPSDKDFLLRFGSILPAHNILPCKFVQCILVMKCRVSNDGGQTSLKINELSMQLEDMVGAHVNGRNSLLVLERAMGCSRSKNHNEVLESYHQYLKAQSELKEEKMRSEGRLDTFCIVSGIAAFATFWYFILGEKIGGIF